MKFPLFTSLLLSAALGLAACSSDQEAISDGNASPLANGGYLKLAVHLPAQTTTVRSANDAFDDGKDSEYQVNTAKLFLYVGNTEETAVFHSAYEITSTDAENYNDTPNQITCVIPIEKDLPSNITGNHIYAFVVLNDNGYVNISSDNKTAVIYLTGENNTTQEFNFQNSTPQDLQKLAFTADASQATAKGFFMLNAPLANVQGGSNAPSNVQYVLLPDATSTFYNSLEEAKKKPSTEIFVERVVAKVTVQEASGTITDNSITQSDESGTNSSTGNLAWRVLGWQLDITNKKSYFLRNTADHASWDALKSNDASVTAPYRFIGSSAVKSGMDTPLYRTYWAKDPNYDNYTADDFNRLQKGDAITNTALGDDNPQYCFDNTFNVANMNQDRTTRAVLKVQVGNGEDLYTLHSDETHVYNAEALKGHIKFHIAQYAPVVEEWEKLKQSTSAPTAADVDYDITHETTDDGHAGYISTIKINYTDTDGNKATKELVNNSSDPMFFNNALGLGSIYKYTDGIAYYGVRIKHFGDELTPWRSGETPSVTTGTIYPTENGEANYLGRYSVLRNNWYDIKVTGLRKMGSSIIPPPAPDDPDDEYHEYMEVTTSVRHWIRRDQGADL